MIKKILPKLQDFLKKLVRVIRLNALCLDSLSIVREILSKRQNFLKNLVMGVAQSAVGYLGTLNIKKEILPKQEASGIKHVIMDQMRLAKNF